MKDTQLIDLFQRARNDQSYAVIEGVQGLKHAVRFKAEIEHYITCDIDLLKKMLAELAEDVLDSILDNITEVNEAVFTKLSPQPHRTKVIALAKRKKYELTDIDNAKPIILLEEPRDLENIGAVIRVSAAADAGAVIITGPLDIWHPAIIRGAAGLHWALPTLAIAELSSFLSNQVSRSIISLDPTGEVISSARIPASSILVFGTERHGISKQLLEQSDLIIRLPMRKGVSSLNLATSVAATLYRL